MICCQRCWQPHHTDSQHQQGVPYKRCDTELCYHFAFVPHFRQLYPSHTFITLVTRSSSHTTPHLKAMHTMCRALPSVICTARCPCQQLLQNTCPQPFLEHSAAGTSLMQTVQAMLLLLLLLEAPAVATQTQLGAKQDQNVALLLRS